MAPRIARIDRFFVAGAAVSDGGHVNAIVTRPLSADRQDAQFAAPESVLFDGVLDAEGCIALVLVARDDTVSKEWQKRREWLEAIEDAIANADTRGTAAISGPIAAGNQVGWVMLVGAIGIGLSLGLYFTRPAADADPLLGQLTIAIAAGGPAYEAREWFCGEGRASYTVCYEVMRTPSHVEKPVHPSTIEPTRRTMIVTTGPPSVVRGRATRMRVSAVDAETGAAVAATVRLLDSNGIFPTNVPFETQLPTGSLTGIRGAIVRGFDRMPLDLLDDEFDWQALEHRTPKGLVMAADYCAGAVRFEVS
jgi:hypothetical protein